MELVKIINLLKELPQDSGLEYEENWDDSSEVQQWRRDALEAIEFAVKSLQQGEIVGTLSINGKEYKIVK